MTTPTPCRESFAARFGEDQAAAVEEAAQTRYFDECEAMSAAGTTSAHADDHFGSESFRYWLLLAIARGIITDPDARAVHGITAPIVSMREWARDHGGLAAHDGNLPSYVAWLGGAFDPWLPPGVDINPCPHVHPADR